MAETSFPPWSEGPSTRQSGWGPYDDEKLGFFKIAKYYYYPGWWEPGPNLSLLVNRDAWDKLPSSYQEIFSTAAKETNLWMLSLYDALNPAALGRLIDAGVQLRPFSKEILAACERARFRADGRGSRQEPFLCPHSSLLERGA